jgi:tetratricopeptide (TPR) repeat protein
LRFSFLDRVSSIYVGGATLQLMLGDYSLIAVAIAGTLAAAMVWTALLRLHAYSWARARRNPLSPRLGEESRRWMLVRQLGMLAAIVGAGSMALLFVYQAKLLPNSELQRTLDAGTFAGVLAFTVAFTAGAAFLALFADGRLRKRSVARRFGMIGFEVPLLTAALFGVVVWYGMRQSVIVSANDVDTPGDLQTYKRVVRLFPDLGLAHYLLGERNLAERNTDEARENLRRAIELDPDFPASYLPLGLLNALNGDPDEALRNADRLIELRPDHPGAPSVRWPTPKRTT